MNYLISGSVVYDNILKFNGEFQKYISPESLDKLNISFPLSSIERQLGGTGGNIYNIAQFLRTKASPLFSHICPDLFTHIGSDHHQYTDYWKNNNIFPNEILLREDSQTATCFILSSKNGNQITSFYAGAMKYNLPIEKIDFKKFTHVLLSPESPLNTISMAKACVKNNVQFYFDPGQCISLFINDYPQDLIFILLNMHGLFINEYESLLLTKFLQNSYEANFMLSTLYKINDKLKFIVNTLGANGVKVILKNEEKIIKPVKIDNPIDPTGCGDSFRAAFFNSYLNNEHIYTSINKANVIASFVVEKYGCNLDNITSHDIVNRYQQYIS